LSDDELRLFREVQQYFNLPGVALVEKDQLVVRAIAALAAIDTKPFALVFGGGTALARAHKIVQRMSEDVDFKIVPLAAAPVSRSQVRQHLGILRDRVTAALQSAGFPFDAANPAHRRSRNENRYTIYQLDYEGRAAAAEALRPTIQIELTYATLRLPSLARPVSSFIAEALHQDPEVPSIPCVSLAETAAEKLIALTRRTAMDLAGLSRDPDPALVRHVYDLHIMREHIDHDQVTALARDIAASDAEEFHNQYPAYAADIAGETRKALEALRTNPIHRQRFDDFVSAMVYGERAEFSNAFATVDKLAGQVW